MSVEAITWALRQPVKPSSTKFVLVVLANCASGDTFLAFPSVQYLADATGQDRKTVIGNLDKLREWGLIEDTGKRTGATKQIPIYRVLCGGDLFHEGAQKRDGSKNGTVPKSPGNSTDFPAQQSQKRDTETSEPKENRQSLSSAAPTPFDRFWTAYPNKTGKRPAETKWKQKRLDARVDEIVADVENRKVRDGRWLEGFVPNPATYLQQERWDDELQPIRENGKPAAPAYVPSKHADAAEVIARDRAANPVKPQEGAKRIGALLQELGRRPLPAEADA